MIIKRLAPRVEIDGILVFDASALGGSTEVGNALRPALDLLRQKDPVRFNRLRRHVREVIVAPISGAEYVHHLDVCFIGASTVQRGPPASLALILVHEATHALLQHRGCGWSTESRPRHEKICLRQEMRCALNLGDPYWIDLIRAKAERPVGRDEEIAARAEEIAALGLPRWFQKLWKYAQS